VFTSRIRQARSGTAHTCLRAHIDDGTTGAVGLAAQLARFHERQHGAHHLQRRAEVDGDDTVKFVVDEGVGGREAVQDAGIVD
jgi:hypothetical protein